LAVTAGYDQTGRYGTQTPFSDQLASHWEAGKWEVDSMHNSLVTVGNGGTGANGGGAWGGGLSYDNSAGAAGNTNTVSLSSSAPAVTIIAWWGSRLVSPRWFLAYSIYTPSIIFATVYLRYHYSVDLLAGAVLAASLIVASPSLYRRLRHEV